MECFLNRAKPSGKDFGKQAQNPQKPNATQRANNRRSSISMSVLEKRFRPFPLKKDSSQNRYHKLLLWHPFNERMPKTEQSFSPNTHSKGTLGIMLIIVKIVSVTTHSFKKTIYTREVL
jgi:hypothetical protein